MFTTAENQIHATFLPGRVVKALLAGGGLFVLQNAHADSTLLTNPANGHQYQRFDTPTLWASARAICVEKGGYLATITTEEENIWVWNNLAKLGSNPRSMLGGTDQRSEGTWEWITGEPWSYTNWDPGEPNDDGGQDVLIFGNFNNGSWDDINDPRDGTSPYICEWDKLVMSFATFTPRAEFWLGPKNNDDSYWVRGYLKLGATSNGINPLNEPVTIQVGNFSHTVPAGSFRQEGASYLFKGPVGPSTLDVRITPSSNPGGYSFKSCLKDGDLNGMVIPPKASLTVGDDTGDATLDVGYAKFGKGKDGQNWVFPPAK